MSKGDIEQGDGENVVYKTKASNKDRKIRKSSLWFMLIVQPGRVGATNCPGDGVSLGGCSSIVDIRLKKTCHCI
ncbi:hypothetical protein OUZ56_010150 [Daphnia magna]|uniref:Uncharacterized protein n=1 Tax=Daphnia magna TaxID=35525 RepID=A0ABR0AI16_9CRUS|nr:hypothetical protein OUZ56_010150 [Daphnia magna]